MVVRYISLALAVIAVAGSAASPAGAQELPQTIYDTLEALTYDDIRALIEKAEAGDGEAQQMLGLAYHHGYTVDQMYTEAVKWYRLAADQGFAHAQDGLGKLYYLGQGVEQDFGEALRWIRLAVEQGLPEGQYGVPGRGNGRDSLVLEASTTQHL